LAAPLMSVLFCSIRAWPSLDFSAALNASPAFGSLSDGTLDHKELHGRISDKDWAVADPDNDKTVSKDEYLAYVEVLFKKADPDNDGTIDAKELSSPAGHALLRLLK
jgi:hypothetical protein